MNGLKESGRKNNITIIIEEINDGYILILYGDWRDIDTEKWFFDSKEDLLANLLERIKRYEDNV